MTIHILLAEDHQIVRDGLRSLLSHQPDMEVIAEAENGRFAVQLAETLRPDVVVMDIAMPEINGIEATRRILDSAPLTKIVALSMHHDKRFVAGMLRAGAVGYLLKDCAFEELVRAIRTVIAGQFYLSPGIADIVVEGYLHQSTLPATSAFSVLTSREREVLQLLAEGHTSKEIAARLHVSLKTVETHRAHIMDKLDIHSVAELVKYAIREGLVSLD